MGCTYSSNDDTSNTLESKVLAQSDKVLTLPRDQPQYDLYSETQRIILFKRVSQESNPENKVLLSEQYLQEELELFVDQLLITYDINKNGLLDLEEFGKLIRESIDASLNQQEIEGLLSVVDNNRNRTIDKQQLRALFKTLIRP